MSKGDKIEIVVSDEAIKAAAACKTNCACLKEGTEELCPVDHCAVGKIHFTKCEKIKTCDFQRSFGHGYYCTCPVRKEIYDKYHI